MTARVLIADDDTVVRDVVRRYLERDGLEVTVAGDGSEALRVLGTQRIDVAVLDVMMPGPSGLSLCRTLRQSGDYSIPVILLTALGEEDDRIAGLEAGADDYLTKPFATDELNARIRAVLRRAGGPDADVQGCLRLGVIEMDQVRRSVSVAGEPVRLTPREYELLKVLLSNQGRVLTKARLLRAVWGLAYAEESTYLHVYVNRLRRKLSAAAGAGTVGASIEGLIETEPGIGYRVADNESVSDTGA
jgi:DNA-binding response OmpR family regulator